MDETNQKPSKILLKNNTYTDDIRLDRVPKFDERSRNFPIRELVPSKKPRSYTWRCDTYLDQKAEGACVGFGITHELIARPVKVTDLDANFARKLYFDAQRIDEWQGGAYPGASPFYEGTSVLAGIKVAKSQGWFEQYRWSFSIDDLILGIGYNGPAVLGLAWTQGMFSTDNNGYIRPTGYLMGGHCIMCCGVNLKKNRFVLHNSWGTNWGVDGKCYVDIDDMKQLLSWDGEAAFFINRKKKI